MYGMKLIIRGKMSAPLKALPVLPGCREFRASRAFSVRPDHKAFKGRWGHRASRDWRELPAPPVHQESPVRMGRLVRKAPKVRLAQPELRDCKGRPVPKAPKVPSGRRAPRAIMDHKEFKVRLVLRDFGERPVLKVKPASRVLPDRSETQVQPELPDLRG